MRKDLWQLIDGIVQNKMRFGILTNATLVRDDIASRLAGYVHRLDYIQVSVDGGHGPVWGPDGSELYYRVASRTGPYM